MGRYKKRFAHEDLENFSEEIVFEQLAAIIERVEKRFCQCDVCIQDIAALALNHVPTLYCCSLLEKTSPNDNFLLKIEDAREKARAALLEAIDVVTAKNNH